MATPTTEDVKPILSPLDLSLKISTTDSYQKAINTSDNQFVNKTKPLDDYKSVSSEELLSLKLLHDRLSKTMELLMPQNKSKVTEEKNSQTSSSGMTSADDNHQLFDKSVENFDYRTTMKALLSLVGSESNSNSLPSELYQSTFEDSKNQAAQLQNKLASPNFDVWSYWHEYLLSLYVMNSTLSSFSAPLPPPSHAPVSVPPSQLYPPNHAYLSPTPPSVLFHNMLNSITQASSSSVSTNNEENNLKNYLLQETLCPDYNFQKNKKPNSYQLLKDSNFLYNSFAFNRNLGLAKTKLLDCPESFGVSLRGNQKYSIYYQQRPTNIFNNNGNFMSPTCQSSFSGKSNINNHSHKTFSTDDSNRRSHIINDISNKKSLSSYHHTNNCKLTKSMNRNDGNISNLKFNQLTTNSCDKINKDSNPDGYTSNNINNAINQNIPSNLLLGGRYRETVFNCSCGEEFENLYSFTIHMKTTHHTPNSTKIDRTIPKLVRGQDMWINSETEQTKEILRCMRCHQSFRTLPELTMHMVETNHYSEIVYNDTGKCVFLNNDNDKTKSHSTVTSSPIPSSPGEIMRNLKRTWSNSNDSDIGEDMNFKFRKISNSPISSSNETEADIGIKTEKFLNDEPNVKELKESEKCKFEIPKENKDLQITEADSGTSDPQPDSDSQIKSYQAIKDFKKEANIDLLGDGLNSCDSVIRQIENFVEKNLPKSVHTEFSNSSLINNTANFSHRAPKTLNHSFHSNKIPNPKANCNEKSNKPEMKTPIPEKSDYNSILKNKSIDEIFSNFNYRSYQSFATDLNENPLSSLQSLVETIQKNPTQTKEQTYLKVSSNSFQSKDPYNNSKSPISCDSLNQMQALVAGTSVNSSCSISSTSISQSDDKKHGNYSNSDNNKKFFHNEVLDSSATLLSWYHKLGELLGLPQALSHAMLTPDALKDLANSVLTISDSKKSQSETVKQTDPQSSCAEDDNNNNHNNYDKSLSTLNSTTSQNMDCDPLEKLKNLLHTTTDVPSANLINSHPSGSNKFHNGPNNHPSSPLTISKKAKCHFCNKPFANKGQVRLHISKGKCPSLLRSCNSNCNTIDSKSNSNMSPLNFESNFHPYNRMNDGNNESGSKPESDNTSNNLSADSVLMSKSVNLIREYFKFARQMIGNEESLKSPKNLVENEID